MKFNIDFFDGKDKIFTSKYRDKFVFGCIYEFDIEKVEKGRKQLKLLCLSDDKLRVLNKEIEKYLSSIEAIKKDKQ